MSARRQSARLSGSQAGSQDVQSPNRKRKARASESPNAKRGGAKAKQQKTLEQTLPGEPDEDTKAAAKVPDADDVPDEAMKNAADQVEDKSATTGKQDEIEQGQLEKDAQDANPEGEAEISTKEDLPNEDVKSTAAPKATEDNKSDDNDNKRTSNHQNAETTQIDHSGKISKVETHNSSAKPTEPSTNGDGAVDSSQGRADAQPSNILEKGIIYFFCRGRVGVDTIADAKDIARSYMVLRPLPPGAKLGEGAIDDLKNNRLLALPKKVLPKSHRDTFMTFVEKAGVSIEELREDFMKGSDYDTKTTGTRHTPSITPIGEGVYSIVTQGRDSHLAYVLTIPSEIGEVQRGIGLAEKGSFSLSTKNPDQDAPANATLPQGPAYPKEVMDEFHGLRWMGCQPKHLDYANAQVLMIGSHPGELGRAVEAASKDENDDKKETPQEELEILEGEDEHRVEALRGDDTVFSDLGLAKGEYPKIKTTW